MVEGSVTPSMKGESAMGAKQCPFTGRFARTRFLAPSAAREFFDRIYVREERERGRERDAMLRGMTEDERQRYARGDGPEEVSPSA